MSHHRNLTLLFAAVVGLVLGSGTRCCSQGYSQDANLAPAYPSSAVPPPVGPSTFNSSPVAPRFADPNTYQSPPWIQSQPDPMLIPIMFWPTIQLESILHGVRRVNIARKLPQALPYSLSLQIRMLS